MWFFVLVASRHYFNTVGHNISEKYAGTDPDMLIVPHTQCYVIDIMSFELV